MSVANGFTFRKNVETLPGKPDIVFPSARVAVFCDGDFWHGRDWKVLRPKLDQGKNATYWSAKIASNIERDKRNTALLRKKVGANQAMGADIKQDPLRAASLIKKAVEARLREAKRTNKPNSSFRG